MRVENIPMTTTRDARISWVKDECSSIQCIPSEWRGEGDEITVQEGGG